MGTLNRTLRGVCRRSGPRYNLVASSLAVLALGLTLALSPSALASRTQRFVMHLGPVRGGTTAGPSPFSDQLTWGNDGSGAQVRANDATASSGAGPLAHAASGPVAHAANVNSVVPDFTIFFNYNVAGRAKLQLLKLFLQPFFSRFEALPVGGCLNCVGRGTFRTVRIKGHTYSENVGGGKIFMSRKTQFVQVLTSADHIGRFRVDGLRVPPPPGVPSPFLLASGCIPAFLPLTSAEAFNWRGLPRVPCKGRAPRNDRVSISAPFELSSTSQLQGHVSGHASSAQWLAVFQGTQPCRANAFAEYLTRTQNFFSVKVKGNFGGSFSTGTTNTPGYFCAYLQDGGTVRLTNGKRLPFGRVGATGNWVYSGGDSLTISGPTTATSGQQVDEVFAGHASLPEELYVFSPIGPCAASAQAEYQALGSSPSNELIFSVHGAFSKGVTVTVSGSGNECGYLQVGAPDHGVPTGPTLVVATHPITLTGPALDRSLRASRQAPTR